METKNVTEEELKASLVEKVEEIAAWFGYGVFIELVKNHGNSECFGTQDMIGKYRDAGIFSEEASFQLITGTNHKDNASEKTSETNGSKQGAMSESEVTKEKGCDGDNTEDGDKDDEDDDKIENVEGPLANEEKNLAGSVDIDNDVIRSEHSCHNDDQPQNANMSVQNSTAGCRKSTCVTTNSVSTQTEDYLQSKKPAPAGNKETARKPETRNLRGAQKRKASLKLTQQQFRDVKDEITAESDNSDETYQPAPKMVKKSKPSRGKAGKKGGTRKKNFKCESCSKTFKDRWHLNRHLFTHMHHKPFTCDVCGNNYKSPVHLKEHLATHSQASKYQCQECKQGFKQRNQYEWHVKKFHTPGVKDPFKCEDCGEVYTRKLALRIHKETHAKDEEKVFICNLCKAKFAIVACFCMHQKSEHGITKYFCPMCGKVLHGLLQMESHVAIHTGEKLFHCDKCGKGYVSESGLKWHQATHVEERPFKCTTCSAGFYTKYDLQKHILTHSTEKEFVCETCGSQFKSRTNLWEHQKRHRGEVSKKFTCEECGTAFYTLSHLHRHMMIHTGVKPYACSVCGKKYSRQDNLRVHLKTHGIIEKPGRSSVKVQEGSKPSNGGQGTNDVVGQGTKDKVVAMPQNPKEMNNRHGSQDKGERSEGKGENSALVISPNGEGRNDQSMQSSSDSQSLKVDESVSHINHNESPKQTLPVPVSHSLMGAVHPRPTLHQLHVVSSSFSQTPAVPQTMSQHQGHAEPIQGQISPALCRVPRGQGQLDPMPSPVQTHAIANPGHMSGQSGEALYGNQQPPVSWPQAVVPNFPQQQQQPQSDKQVAMQEIYQQQSSESTDLYPVTARYGSTQRYH
ncbi:uncharacterized protein [Ptychodera flava]|uniref:uncharacterized protein n=1 Tax=Ptychodera flava TaxID=63121 RepID=UPI00396A3BAD